ncbi:TIGR01777 family oxidoreductase [Silvibacterium acidisoli]|uniref:TIGR01777 family oxidoreductase n=1 Tax=Acidobacteriaceae bacterium ZG23-2 TaxID=2883246 RepID=UPI00406CB060
MRIVIPGGSGQVGQILARHFHAQNHDVIVLSRSVKPAPWSVLRWNAATAGDVLERADVCINLIGRSVNCRYDEANRREIYDSRILSTRLLNQVVGSLRHPPLVWLNASTATIYRHAFDRDMDEATGEMGGGEPGAPETWNFSIRVARDWESEFFNTQMPRTRKVALRSALTLSPDRDGIFSVLSSLVRYGLGGPMGAGSQYVSWIHEEDFVRAVEWLIAHEEINGAVNLASPYPLPNRDFMRILREAWGAPIGLPAPAWLLEIGTFLMRTESELVLKSRRVVPGRMRDAGFKFRFAGWRDAAEDLVHRWRQIKSGAS